MINLHFTFLVGVLTFEIGIAFGNDPISCLQNQGLALSVVKALTMEMECATNEEDLTTTNVNVAYGPPGIEILSDESKNGLGMYHYFGHMKKDGSAVYIQSDQPASGFKRSVILIDCEGGHNWIGTSELGADRSTSTWLKNVHGTKKNIEDCRHESWLTRVDETFWTYMGLQVSYSKATAPTSAATTSITAVNSSTETMPTTAVPTSVETMPTNEVPTIVETRPTTSLPTGAETMPTSGLNTSSETMTTITGPVENTNTPKVRCRIEGWSCIQNDPEYPCCEGLRCEPKENGEIGACIRQINETE
jgi:hypothetical protein